MAANTAHTTIRNPLCHLFQRGIIKKKERRENVNGTEHYSATAGEAAADPPGVRVKMFCCANVDRPRPCECFLWCPRSSAPDPVVPARWAVSQGCRTPPDTKNKIKHVRNQKGRLRISAHLAPPPPYSLVVDDVLVFPGHSGRPFPGLLVQTVLLRRPRLRLQLTTLMDKHTHACTRESTPRCAPCAVTHRSGC